MRWCAVYVCAYKPMEDFAVSVKGIEREYDDVGIICFLIVQLTYFHNLVVSVAAFVGFSNLCAIASRRAIRFPKSC